MAEPLTPEKVAEIRAWATTAMRVSSAFADAPVPTSSADIFKLAQLLSNLLDSLATVNTDLANAKTESLRFKRTAHVFSDTLYERDATIARMTLELDEARRQFDYLAALFFDADRGEVSDDYAKQPLR